MKHILNDMSEQEKNSIREQHTGGMKIMTENFSKLINSKLGDSKPLLKEEDMDDDEKTITDTIFKCAEDVEQEGYDDFFDWANIVFSCAEWKLEEIFDEDIVENLRSNYTEIIQGMWQGGDDEFEF